MAHAEDRLPELRSQATQGELTTKFFDEAQFLLLSPDGLFAVLTQDKRVQDANHVAAMHNTQEELLEVVRAAREAIEPKSVLSYNPLVRAIQALDAKGGAL